MPACIAVREEHRWHPELPPEQAWKSEDETKKVYSYVFVVGNHYMDLKLRNKEVVGASAGERQIISTNPTTKVRHTPILNSYGPDSHDINEPFESIFTVQSDAPRGVGFYVETGSMPCPEREMKVTDFDVNWVETKICAGPNSVEHYAWILQSEDYHRKTFVGKIGGRYMVLQKNKEGEQFGVRLGEWQPQIKKWKTLLSIGDVRKTPFDCQAHGCLGIFGEEEDWRKFQFVPVAGMYYYVKAHEFTGSEEAKAFVLTH